MIFSFLLLRLTLFENPKTFLSSSTSSRNSTLKSGFALHKTKKKRDGGKRYRCDRQVQPKSLKVFFFSVLWEIFSVSLGKNARIVLFLVEDSVELKKHKTNTIFSFDEIQKFGKGWNIFNQILVWEKEFERKKKSREIKINGGAKNELWSLNKMKWGKFKYFLSINKFSEA